MIIPFCIKSNNSQFQMDKFNGTDKSQIKIEFGNLRIFRKHTSEPKIGNMCIMLTKDKVPGGFT